MRRFLPIFTVAVLSLVGAGFAHAEPAKCRHEIVKHGAKLAQVRAAVLGRCETDKLGGKLPSTTECAVEPKTAAKIAGAEAKLRSGIAKACGGRNKTCNAADVGDDADDALPAIGWDIGRCPSVQGADCDAAILGCGDVGDCVTCLARTAVDRTTALTTDDLAPSVPREPLALCQTAIGDATADLLATTAKALAKCEAGVLAGKLAGPCPDGTAALAIAKARGAARARICKICGGGDRACGGGDDLDAGLIGFPTSCPAVTAPGGAGCGGTVTTLEDLAACAECVVAFETGCFDAATVPGLVALPPACAVQPTPTPTATATPTRTPTPSPTATPPAGADALRCERTLVKQAAKLAQAELDARRDCEGAKLAGKRPSSTDCASDGGTTARIAKARGKLAAAVRKACGGANAVCDPLDSGRDGDPTLAEIGWDLAACPNFANGACAGPLVDCNDVATCVACVSDAATRDAVDLLYGQLLAAPAGSDLARCQKTIGEATARFFAAKSQALQKCTDAVVAGRAPGPCPEPGDGKAAAAIAKAELKKVQAICRACGGADGACGGGDDAMPSAIGFASACPAVTTVDGEACGRPIATLTDLVTCVDCVTHFTADCLARLAIPGLQGYPAACNPGEPVATPTPSPTHTVGTPGGPTVTPTPAATASPSGPRCGDGIRQRNLGEDCDDGNTLNCDACPADCHTSFPSCSVTSTYAQPIQIEAPVGTPLGGATICIDYPPGTVALPQNANGQVPTSRIGYTGGFFSAVDFENAVQIALTQTPADDRVDLTVTFDRCGTAPIPPPTTYRCRTVSAADDLGTAVDPVSIVCTASEP